MVTDNTKFQASPRTRFRCPFDKRYICGNYASLADYDQWASEKTCKLMCGRGHRHAAAVQSGEWNKRYPKANQIRRFQNQSPKRAYQVRQLGRVVDAGFRAPVRQDPRALVQRGRKRI